MPTAITRTAIESAAVMPIEEGPRSNGEFILKSIPRFSRQVILIHEVRLLRSESDVLIEHEYAAGVTRRKLHLLCAENRDEI